MLMLNTWLKQWESSLDDVISQNSIIDSNALAFSIATYSDLEMMVIKNGNSNANANVIMDSLV